jgi:hypothetical protein
MVYARGLEASWFEEQNHQPGSPRTLPSVYPERGYLAAPSLIKQVQF